MSLPLHDMPVAQHCVHQATCSCCICTSPQHLHLTTTLHRLVTIQKLFQPVQLMCRCRLNLLCAAGTSLLRIPVHTFGITKRGAGGKAVATIFDEVRGRKQLPRMLLRSMTSGLQRLSSGGVPLPRCVAAVAGC